MNDIPYLRPAVRPSRPARMIGNRLTRWDGPDFLMPLGYDPYLVKCARAACEAFKIRRNE